MNTNGQTFYAIAYEIHINPVTIKPGLEYLHALNEPNARFKFLAALPEIQRNKVKIVAIGPVIGYNVLDNHGEKLSV